MERPADLKLSEIEHLILGSNLSIYDVDTKEEWTYDVRENEPEDIPKQLLDKYVVIIMPAYNHQTNKEYLDIAVCE